MAAGAFACYATWADKPFEGLGAVLFHGNASALAWVKFTVFTLGAVLMALNVVVPVLSAARVFRSGYLVFETEGGRLRVSIAAIEEALVRAARTLPEVADIRIRMVAHHGAEKPLGIVVRAILWEVPDLRAVELKLRRVLNDRFSEILPGEQPLRCEITVEKFRVEKSKGPKGPDQEQPTVDSFRPKYPLPE